MKRGNREEGRGNNTHNITSPRRTAPLSLVRRGDGGEVLRSVLHSTEKGYILFFNIFYFFTVFTTL